MDWRNPARVYCTLCAQELFHEGAKANRTLSNLIRDILARLVTN